MARTTKIPCEGVIYTVREDAYGSVIETDEVAAVPPDETEPADERARYAQVLAELDELEVALTQAEAQAAFNEQLNDREADTDEEMLPFL